MELFYYLCVIYYINLELFRKNKLYKLKIKNRGNNKLISAIDRLIFDIENAEWKNKTEILKSRPDADCI